MSRAARCTNPPVHYLIVSLNDWYNLFKNKWILVYMWAVRYFPLCYYKSHCGFVDSNLAFVKLHSHSQAFHCTWCSVETQTRSQWKHPYQKCPLIGFIRFKCVLFVWLLCVDWSQAAEVCAIYIPPVSKQRNLPESQVPPQNNGNQTRSHLPTCSPLCFSTVPSLTLSFFKNVTVIRNIKYWKLEDHD